MKQLITILMAAAMLQSCIPSRVMNEFTRPSLREPSRKEIRHERKGQRKLAKVLRKYPEVQRIDSLITPISIITPQVRGQIIQPLMVPVHHMRKVTEYIEVPGAELKSPDFSVDFDDPNLTARFSLLDGISALDYTIKPMAVDTMTTTPCPTVQPKEYVRLPLKWWQIGLMVCGGIYILQVAIRALLKLPSPL